MKGVDEVVLSGWNSSEVGVSEMWVGEGGGGLDTGGKKWVVEVKKKRFEKMDG